MEYKRKRLSLISPEGADTTQIAAALANELGWRVIDVDRRVEELEGLTVQEIRVRFSEKYLLKSRELAIYNILEMMRPPIVILVSDNVFGDCDARAELLKCSTVVWLDGHPVEGSMRQLLKHAEIRVDAVRSGHRAFEHVLRAMALLEVPE